MKTSIDVKFVMVTPEMAREMLKKNGINRPINKNTVKHYVKSMKNGEWVLNGEGLSFAADGTLLNGQHRLTAVIESGMNIPFQVSYGVSKESFSTFDQGRKRTDRDIFAIAGIPCYIKKAAMVKNTIVLNKSKASVITGVVTGGITGRANIVLTKKEVLDTYLNDRENYDKYFKMGDSYYHRCGFIATGQICAIIYHLAVRLGYSDFAVTSFFDTLYDKSDSVVIAKRLRKMLIDDAFSQKRMTSYVKSQAVIRAWNGYVEKQQRRNLLVSKDDEPEIFK